jgi:hypothetical protein
MRRIHLVAQGKGGVGKSVVACLLAQYLLDSGKEVTCFDTDLVTPSFSEYKRFQFEDIQEAKKNDGEYDGQYFETIFSKAIAARGDVVIDSGASTFIPLIQYLNSFDICSTLDSIGVELIVHSVATGNEDEVNTFLGLLDIAKSKISKFVIWQNQYFGKANPKALKSWGPSELAKIIAQPVLQTGNGLVLDSFHLLLKSRKTFAEHVDNPEVFLFDRARMKSLRDQIYAEISKIPMCHAESEAA